MKEIKKQELQEINGGSGVLVVAALIVAAGMLKGCSDGSK
ncbi:class IIb bacteriocin, lactobin A/cerein 7B family [Clostridium sp. L74]|nr:class IIb bacteriocin, lactobin A/cerein 7B family [Clostridium sp. L74]KOR25287.1 hypothetical protein ND00_18360 [Clostridium sp. L74]